MVGGALMTKWRWVLLQFARRLWVRASLFAVLGVVTALAAAVLEPLIPRSWTGQVGADAVDQILNILASSMLAVTTFSLSVMVASYGAATQNVTPRATRLLLQDTTSQTVLSTFIGTFLFSLVGIISLAMRIYGSQGRLILFVVTLGVIGVVVVAILRWIDHLSHFGRVGNTTRRVEEAAAKALRARLATPFLGGTPWPLDQDAPATARPVAAAGVGYVQHVDMPALSAICDRADIHLHIAAGAGAFVDGATPLVHVTGAAGEDGDDLAARIRGCFSIGDMRSFDQDPRFGISVLGEIADKALSSAMNDPGTAIDVIGRAVRLMSMWVDVEPTRPGEIAYPRLHVRPLAVGDLFDDIFNPIAREGAGILEVQVRLQKALLMLAGKGDDLAVHAARHAERAMTQAGAALALSEDRARIERLAEQVRRRPTP